MTSTSLVSLVSLVSLASLLSLLSFCPSVLLSFCASARMRVFRCLPTSVSAALSITEASLSDFLPFLYAHSPGDSAAAPVTRKRLTIDD
ncbi:MAG: hypothetical protein EHM23_05535 [Acidobacteria bacterium]|nr:MAG: hypothetical protein EHM23_05535 [Acidobacteriota bacterium]